MKFKKDLIFILGVATFFLPFFISREVFDTYYQFNLEHGVANELYQVLNPGDPG